MSGPLGSQQWMYATETPFYSYPINNSLRFDGSSYLRRLSATSSKIHQFTMSFWVKISDGGSSTSTPYHLMSFQTTGSTATTGLCLYDNEITYFFNNSAYASFNPAKARDYSGWYHVVWKNKSDYYADIYVNGVLVGTTVPSFEIINGSVISVGAGVSGNNPFAGGYIADVHFVSGQSLGPDSFGEHDSTGTIWKPKAFSGSHGTDGFHLDFADGADLGKDVSGNGNDLTPTNIATSDQMLDSPTNNFCTFNELDKATGHVNSEGNLKTATTIAGSSMTKSTVVMSTARETTSKWYAEFYYQANTDTSNVAFIGVTEAGTDPDSAAYQSATTYGYYAFTGNFFDAGTGDVYGGAYAVGDIVGVSFDESTGELEFFKNNVSQGVAKSGLSGDFVFFAADASGYRSVTIVANFGQDSSFAGNKTRQNNADENGYGDFYYTPPSGHLALCSANLPTPTFDPAVGASPQDAFNVYTDTGANILSTAQSDYSDGLFWIKDYQNSADHQLVDSVRGLTKELSTNSTAIEGTYAAPAGASVAWAWNAPTIFSNNTDGTITSSGRVNQSAGFSIVNYTVLQPNDPVGHALGEVPAVIIAKQTAVDATWFLLTNLIDGSIDYLKLQTTDAKVDYGSGAFTATTFTNPYGAASSDVIAYCFAEVEGFSKFGSYTGNNSTDGPFIYTGFKPAFVIVKRTDATANWIMMDTTRDSYNVADAVLYPNIIDAEATADETDFLSNGFKLRHTDADGNASGGTYLYMAFAEQPFKYSTAR